MMMKQERSRRISFQRATQLGLCCVLGYGLCVPLLLLLLSPRSSSLTCYHRPEDDTLYGDHCVAQEVVYLQNEQQWLVVSGTTLDEVVATTPYLRSQTDFAGNLLHLRFGVRSYVSELAFMDPPFFTAMLRCFREQRLAIVLNSRSLGNVYHALIDRVYPLFVLLWTELGQPDGATSFDPDSVVFYNDRRDGSQSHVSVPHIDAMMRAMSSEPVRLLGTSVYPARTGAVHRMVLPNTCFRKVHLGYRPEHHFSRLASDLVLPRSKDPKQWQGLERSTNAFRRFVRDVFTVPMDDPATASIDVLLIHRSTRRRIANEAGMVSVAQRLGLSVKVVDIVGSIPFAEQLRLFSKARVIAAAHGAVFGNLPFVRRDAVIIQLYPYGLLSQWDAGTRSRTLGRNFQILSEAAARRYFAWSCPLHLSRWSTYLVSTSPDDEPPAPSRQDIVDPMDFFERSHIPAADAFMVDERCDFLVDLLCWETLLQAAVDPDFDMSRLDQRGVLC